MLVHQLGQAQLGAHTVSAGDQHRLFHPGHLRGEHAAEAAQRPHDAGDVGGLHHGLDAAYRLIAGGDVHAGGGVGLGMGVFHGKTSKDLECRMQSAECRMERPLCKGTASGELGIRVIRMLWSMI